MREKEQTANERRQIITLNFKALKSQQKHNLYQKIHRDKSRYYQFVSRNDRNLIEISS